ncbi:MAG: phytanoyl-CoA dioxygenase family protein [Woeseiaceae bacterium]|nr:phytanoyl-CoA dioxygenase family protein [Woeseiaceae bacterium]
MSESIPAYEATQSGALTPAMLADYRESGVLILRNFVSRDDCDSLKQRMLEMVDAFDPATVKTVFSTASDSHQADDYFIESGDKIRFFLEDGAFDDEGNLRQSKADSLNKVGHAMHDLDPVFDAFSRTPKLAGVAASLGFEEPGIIQSMYIFKPPRIGGEVLCHQDSTYIYTEPESCAGFWFALEDATIENGCMRFIPGAHKAPLRKRNYRDESGAIVNEIIDETPFDLADTVPAEAPAGTLVVFDGRAPHYSGPNLSDRSRHAYTLHVIDQACHYPESNWLQRNADLPLRGFHA